MPLVLRSSKGSELTHAEMDGNFTTLQTDLANAQIAPVPQFEVGVGQTLALTRALHQGATIILSGAGATVSFSATTQGDGFAVVIANETGSAWTVPTFTGATNRYAKGAAHTQIENGGEASLEVRTWGGTRRVKINGDTV